jgi:hypothetical protein
VGSRACALVCLAAGVVIGRPAAASMTMVFRDGKGQTRTYHQEGTRVRVANPSGTDPGEAAIVDLQSKEHFLIYDDAKAYVDFSKTPAPLRAAPSERRRPATASYRALHESRMVNGYSCERYQHVVARRVDAEICFALWGDAIGQAEDFAWLDKLAERIGSDVAGKTARLAVARPDDPAPGLAIWTSLIEKDGTRNVLEIVTIRRDPLQPAMFKVPANYKEVARPLSASERPHKAPARAQDASPGSAARPPGGRISGLVITLLAVGLVIGLLVHSTMLHLAACVVLDQPRFTQALIAAVVVWAVLVVAELFHIPTGITAALGAFATFAALKISYGASIGRTLALFVVSGLIAALAAYAGAILRH